MATATPTKPGADSARNGDGPPAAGWKPELRDIPVDAIDVGVNVRSAAALDVQELATSIRAQGVISPIRVEEAGTPDGTPRYALVYGQRRLAAAKVAGLATIPALVDAKNRTGAGLLVAQLLENLQREDLNAVDTAKAYRTLLDAGMSQRELGEQLGIAQPTIANTLRLLKAPDAIRERVAAGELTRSHAEAIAKLPDVEQEEVARRIVEHKLSTRDVEKEIDLAEARRSHADRLRDEARQLADAAEEALAKKKAATKEAARLQAYDQQLRDELAKRGWTMVDKTVGYQKPKGCDCPAWSISRNYMGGNQTSVTLTGACIVQAHVDAAAKAAVKEQSQRAAEYQAQQDAERAAEREKEAKAMAPVIERLVADPELRGRVLLWSLAQSAWGSTAEAFEEEVDTQSSWVSIAKMPIGDVERWALAFLAEDVVDAPDVLAAVVPPAKGKKAKAE